MKKNKIIEILLVICVSYTVISLAVSILNASVLGRIRDYDQLYNVIAMFSWTVIAVLILYTHNLFEKIHPVIMIIIQYAAAAALILLYIFISSFFGELHPDSYKDALRSFTIFYVIGAVLYYIEIFHSAKKQNAMLSEIKRRKKETKKQG